MPEKRKRPNFRLMSNIKTWAIGILVAVVAVSITFVWLTLRDNVKLTIGVQEAAVEIDEAEAKVDKSTEQFLPTLDTLIEDVMITNDKLELELRKPNERLGVWEIKTFTAYTSLDDGVNEIAKNGMNIAKYSNSINFAAAAGDSFADDGDTLMVKMSDGTIKCWLVVDTGGGLEANLDDVAEFDLYFGNDLDAAFEFGKQQLEVWIVKN